MKFFNTFARVFFENAANTPVE